MWSRIREIVRKEFRQTLREPRARILLFMPPLIQLIIFGYAVNLDVEDNAIAWLDEDRTLQSRQLLADLEGSRYFRITQEIEDGSQARMLLDRGQVVAVVQVLPGYSRELRSGGTATVQILVDGSNSNTASIASNYLSLIVGRHMRHLQRQRLNLSAGSDPGTPAPAMSPPLELRSRVWFNPNLRSRDYFVPGVVVNIIGLVTVMLTAMAVVREKEIGTMEQLMVTPIRPSELMLGKTLPFAVIGVFEVILVTLAALLIFKIPFRGSATLLLAGSILYLLTTLGAGLLISTISGTQQQAMMGTFFFFLPALMLSGFAFPIRNMPVAVQYLTFLNPMRYFMEIVRGIFLKGVGLTVLWPQMTALLLFGLIMITLSTLRFRKRLD